MNDDTCDYEDNYSFVSGGGCTRLNYEDVLYRFEAPSDGNYRVRVAADWLDLEVAVNVIVADECPATAPSTCSASAVNDFDFEVATTSSFAMTAGQTAWIVVGSGFSSQECDFFSVEVEAAP